MACKTCSGNSSSLCAGCVRPKKMQLCSDCLPWSDQWVVKVDTIPDPFEADYNHIYQLPDNKFYILSHDRMSMIEINKDGGSEGGNPPPQIDLSGYASKEELEKLKDDLTYTAGDNITITDRVISAIGISSNVDNELSTIKERLAGVEHSALYLEDNKQVVLKAGEGIEILNQGTNNATITAKIPKTATLVKSDTPTDIYSFTITPYASTIKKDITKTGDEAIMYNATINPIYTSGIMFSSGDKEHYISWQQLFLEYGVLATLSVAFNEQQFLGQAIYRLDANHNLYVATQDINDNIGYITKAGQKSKGKTVGNYLVNNGISWARLDVTYYKIALE